MMIQKNILDDLSEIKISKDQSLLHEMVGMYFVQTPERLVRLRAAIKNSNIDMISRTAHALKSSSSFLGLRKMVILCAEFEKLNKNNTSIPIEEAYILLNVLEESFEESCDELKIYLVNYQIH